MPDTAPVHTEAVTETPDPAAAERHAAARTAMAEHKASCRDRDRGLPCQECARLTAAWRKALRDASLTGRAGAGVRAATTTGGGQ